MAQDRQQLLAAIAKLEQQKRLKHTRKAMKPGDRSDHEVGAERSGERNRESTNRKGA